LKSNFLGLKWSLKMAETIIDKNLAKERLEKYLATHDVKVAKTFEELLGPKTEQTQEEIQTEVDEFLSMLKEWRKDTHDRSID
jgi:hypothetical protein